MRITIDGKYCMTADGNRGAGTEHYVWELIIALLKTKNKDTKVWIDIPLKANPQAVRDLQSFSGVKVVRASRFHIPFVSRHILLPIRWFFRRNTLVLIPAGQIPWGFRGKSVLIVHDVSIYRHPEWFAKKVVNSWSTKKRNPQSFKEATKIVCVSAFTERTLIELFPDAKGKTTVIPEGVNVPAKTSVALDRRVHDSFGLQEDTLLYLGTIEPRKGVEEAIRAFDKFLLTRPAYAKTVRFVLAGRQGIGAESTDKLIQEVNRRWRQKLPDYVIRPIGYVTEEEKWSLLSQASALVFPSFEEGFGRPVLEALSVGCPVITTEAGAIPEVAGDAAVYVDPNDGEAFSLAMAQVLLLTEATDQLRERGMIQIKQFDWQKIGERFWKVLNETEKIKSKVSKR